MNKVSEYNRLIVSLLDHLKKSGKNITAIMVAKRLSISVKDLYNIRAGTKKGTEKLFLEIAAKFPEEYRTFEPPPKEDAIDIQKHYQFLVNELTMQLKYLREENEQLKYENKNVRIQLLEVAELVQEAFPGEELKKMREKFEKMLGIK